MPHTLVKQRRVRRTLVRNRNELPLLMRIVDVQSLADCSKSKAYELSYASGAIIHIGRNLRIHRDRFLSFLGEQGREEQEDLTR